MSLTYIKNDGTVKEFGSPEVKNNNVITNNKSGILMIDNVVVDPSSNVPDDLSSLKLQHGPNFMDFKNDATVLHSDPELLFKTGSHLFESVAGDKQSVIQGDKNDLHHGDSTEQGGQATTKYVEAAKKLQTATTQIDKKKIEHIQKTKGDEVDCPVCSSQVLTDRAQCLLDLVVALIRLAIPNFPYPLDVLQKILNFLGIPFQSPEDVKTLNGGEGCGSPGCKNGKIRSLQKPIQEANKNAAQELKSKQNEIGQHQKDMGSGGTKSIGPFTGDVALWVGHPDAINNSPTVALTDEHDVTPFGFTNKTTPQGVGFIPMTKGNCKKAVHSDPLINPGSLFIGVTNKFTLAAGSPGIDIHTTGKAALNAAVTDIVASEGELMLRSNNKTTLKGKNVIIDANDGSGDSGIRLDAKNVMIAGALHVQGDHAIKGHVGVDGGISCTHITAPGERVATGPSGSGHQVHSGATWNNPVAGLPASIYDQYDKLYKKISRDVFNFLSLNIANGMAEIKTLIEETYHSALLDIPVDGNGLPTGFAMSMNSVVPGNEPSQPLLVNGIALDSLGKPITFVYTFVVPGQFLPIYNFTHNHNSPGANHSHDYTAIRSDPMGTNTAARAARPEPSNVPSPAKATGHGSPGGHKNFGDLCLPCINPFGGNGARNARYGLSPQQGNFTEGNYVPADGTFDDQGNLFPPPSIDLNCP